MASSTSQLIHEAAYRHGVSEAEMLGTIQCESHMNPHAIGDHGHSFGLAQIYLPAHKDVTREQALDPTFATNWMASQFAIHNQHLWTCARMLGY